MCPLGTGQAPKAVKDFCHFKVNGLNPTISARQALLFRRINHLVNHLIKVFCWKNANLQDCFFVLSKMGQHRSYRDRLHIWNFLHFIRHLGKYLLL